MDITLYTAPDCLRCKIVKAWLDGKGIAYGTLDYKADADAFNAFYRTNRKAIYRNPEGVEFPLFHRGDVIRQGTGEIIAHLLAGTAMEGCVTRSDLLHGWISGLYPDRCPTAQEDNFVALVAALDKGGLKTCVRTEGCKPALLQRLLQAGSVSRVELAIAGPAPVYTTLYGAAPTAEALAQSIALVQAQPDSCIYLDVLPYCENGTWRWLTPEEVAEGAAMVASACGNPQLPCFLRVATGPTVQGEHTLDSSSVNLLKYRQAVRRHLYKVEIAKQQG